MPFRWLSQNLARLWFLTGILAFTTCGLFIISGRQAAAYRDLYKKHEDAMRALEGLDYDLARGRFLMEKMGAKTKQEYQRAADALRAFDREYPNPTIYKEKVNPR